MVARTNKEIDVLLRHFKKVPQSSILGDLLISQAGMDEDDVPEYEIRFSNCEFKNDLVISEIVNSAIFISCKFSGTVKVNNVTKAIQLEFTDCVFNSEVEFEDNVISVFTFNSNEVKDRVGVKNFESKYFTIHKLNTEQGYFILANPKIQNFSFIEFDKKSSFTVQVIKPKDKQNNWDYYIQKAHFFLSPENSSSVFVSDICIKELLIEGGSRDADIYFDSIKTQIVELKKFNCSSELRFKEVRKLDAVEKAVLKISSTQLSKVRLFNVDFNFFNDVLMTDSVVSEINYGNVTWCNEINNSYMERTDSFFQSKEIYRQLKSIMINNHDKISELKFHKLEMNAYLNGVLLKPGKYAEKFILGTNYISNNHGLSWTWSFWWIIGISLIVFNLNKFLLGYNGFDSSLFFEDAANWLLSINPVRKFSDVYKGHNLGWQQGLAQFIDVFMRIVYSYLIFQFISAFRKYVKK